MKSFDYHPRTRVVFGNHSLDRLGELAKELDAKRVLLVSAPGIVEAGHTNRGAESLRSAGLDVFLFTKVEENPTTLHVDAGVEFAKAHRIDFIVGLGGGSSMDCARGINFLLTNGGKMQDYCGLGKAGKAMLPMIAVPTTAGTGSEAQSFALIADEKTHQKMACGDKKAACRVAILDPTVTVTQPPAGTAITGLDALAHSLETYVCSRRSPVSQLFSLEAWKLLEPSLEKVLENPHDLEARGRMLLGANFAGSAIEYSMLGAAHACANPLTAHIDITHGIAGSMMLPHVIRFNSEEVSDLYGGLAQLAQLNGADPIEALIQRILQLIDKCGLPLKLADAGAQHDLIPQLAEEAAKQWTGTFNPRKLTTDDFADLYGQAFGLSEFVRP